jgi:tRNA(Arg) A34 adenosine deaminase TadA
MRFDGCYCSRREAMVVAASLVMVLVKQARAEGHERYIAEAFRQRSIAIAAGDQPYGAVVVRAGMIIGRGASRVVQDRNIDAHAERLAIADAMARAGSSDLSGAILYSSSRPCRTCERVAANAGISRMIYGQGTADGGAPRG